MAKYIDADKAIEVIINTPSMVGSKYDFDHDVLTALVDKEHEIIDLINNNVPTADVAPVIHAYWIMGGSQKYDEGRLNIMHCSNCKAYFRYIGRKKNINYCYRCGAVMEGIKDAKIHKHR